MKVREMYAIPRQSAEGLEAALGGPIPEEYVPKLRALREELEQHKMLEAQRQRTRPRTIVRRDLVERAFQIGAEYAKATYDPDAEEGDETRCGGFLYLIGDWQEPGMSTDWISPDGFTLPRQIETEQEFYLGIEPFENGISMTDDERPGLEDLMSHYLSQPHSENNDLAIFIDHDDGEITSTHAHIEGVRGAKINLDPKIYKGGAKARASTYFTTHNPDDIAIMGSGAGFVYLIQHGQVRAKYDVENDRFVLYSQLVASTITSSDEKCSYAA